jgi:uncharacterized membrane protein YhaH (DUF805 family)
VDWNYLYASFDGRLNRKPYWIANLILIAAGMTLSFVLVSTAGLTAATVFSLVWIYPTFALNVKRAHDRNRPTWLIVAFFGLLVLINLSQVFGLDRTGDEPTTLLLILGIPWFLLALFFFVDLGFLRGTRGPNRYGPDPLT